MSSEIAGMSVRPGTKQRGFLRIGPYFPERTFVRQYVLVPITVIKGIKPGPTLAQTAGCHPTEYAGMDATIRLCNELKPEELSGTFIGVSCLNVPGFSQRAYINPLDGKNIQERYPGRRDGTISDVMAYVLFNDIVLKCDYFLDCHGGDIHESEVWSFLYYKTDDEVEKKSEAIARATGITYISKSVYPGMGYEAAKRGVPGGLFELSTGDKLIPEESAAIFEGTLNVMRHLRMLEGSPKPINGQPFTVKGQKQEIWASDASTYFTKSGLFHTNVKPGDILKQGQVVGTVTDLWGDVVETIYAPATGRVMLMSHNPAVNAGEEAISVYW